MEIILRSKNRRVKQKIERDHQWYDSVSKQMKHYHGGEMTFVYDKKQKRSVPKIVDQESWVSRNDYSMLVEWVKENKDKYDITIVSSANGHFILIDVNDSHVDDITSDLYRENILFDY